MVTIYYTILLLIILWEIDFLINFNYKFRWLTTITKLSTHESKLRKKGIVDIKRSNMIYRSYFIVGILAMFYVIINIGGFFIINKPFVWLIFVVIFFNLLKKITEKTKYHKLMFLIGTVANIITYSIIYFFDYHKIYI